MNEFLNIAKRRRMVRKFTKEPVSRQALQNILEAARWAPSGYNLQPWYFVVVQSPEQRARLVQAAQHETDYWQRRGFSVSLPEYLKSVTLFIAIIVDPGKKKEFPSHRTGATADKIFLSSISAAIQNIHLAAAAEGLGSVWYTVGSETENQAAYKSALNVPAEYDVAYVIPIGHPVDPLGDPDPSQRNPIESIVRWEKFS